MSFFFLSIGSGHDNRVSELLSHCPPSLGLAQFRGGTYGCQACFVALFPTRNREPPQNCAKPRSVSCYSKTDIVMKQILLGIFILTTTISSGQNISAKLKNVRTLGDAEKFISSNPSLATEMVFLSSDVDTSDLQKQLLTKSKGDVFKIDGYLYKVVSDTTIKSLRGSYIYLDGSKLSLSEIDSIRNLIMTKYNSGTTFLDLFKEYNMDGNPNDGDLGWFQEGMMVKEFDVAIQEHKKDDVFKVDVPSNNWFYIVKKTYDDKTTKEVTLLKIKSSS